MSSGHRTLAAFIATISALVLAIVELCVDWSGWLWPSLAAALLICLVVSMRAKAPASGYIPPENTLEPDLPIPPPLRQECRVAQVALPSAAPDYDFLFSATVRWVPQEIDVPSSFDPGGIAVQAVLLRARAFAVRQYPTSSTLAQHQLNGYLGVMEADPTGRVLAMARNVTLTLSESDHARLVRLSDVRKDEQVWEHERNYEKNKRAYLTNDVLKDTGSTVVWWLSRNDEQVEGTVDRIGILARLSAAANNSEVMPPFRDLVHPVLSEPPVEQEERVKEPPPEAADVVAEALMEWLRLGRDTPEMHHLAWRFAEYLRGAGKVEEAQDFFRIFDPGDEEGAPDVDQDGDGAAGAWF
ncbi:hypothetical protein [Streptomyces hainanensis]|uniref:hypothetical protein n=1 Tax=Streptomyces hainanensis TaxID=402648 RepID=UPI001A9CD580|nr:hypothetical protein [Streptomyces hainanensis]